MNRERIVEVVLTMLGAVLLLVASAGKQPYGFYMVLRLVITVGAIYWAWRVCKAALWGWSWAFVAVALLLNPFLPIRMHREDWQPIDLSLGILLIGWSGYWLFRNAQTNLETHYNDAQNAIKAARLRTAAEQGDAEAQEGLGFFYCIGAGVPRDYVQAATWFRKAAEQGNAEAQYRLGLSYYKGEGVPKDYAQAAFWWRKAAEQGEDTARYNLKCLLHYKGEDVP